jgi:hypothetical protein
MDSHDIVLLPDERIQNRIFLIRGKKVMFDRDLAELYGVRTQVLNQAVRRNQLRFPVDFMFQLTKDETENWISQIVISKNQQKGVRKCPFAFTEQGIAMLSSVLRSDRAIFVNIQIIRTFTKLRELMTTNKELREKIEQLEQKYDAQFQVIFDVIKQLIDGEEEEKPMIGFRG